MIFILLIIICFSTAFFTTVSGFGLGTIMLPVFSVFVPVDQAILLTALVHFANNIGKFFLFKQYISKEVLLKFGITALVGSLIGAFLLQWFSTKNIFFTHELFEKQWEVTWLNFTVGVLLFIFSFLELVPSFKKAGVDSKFLPLGGFLSGFFGGFSGHQGALRNIFLLKTALSKEQIIGTGVVIACIIDTTRVSIYFPSIIKNTFSIHWDYVIIGSISAILGSIFSKRILKQFNTKNFKLVVAVCLLLFSVGLMLGFI